MEEAAAGSTWPAGFIALAREPRCATAIATGEGQSEANLLPDPRLVVDNYFLIDQAFNDYQRKAAQTAPNRRPGRPVIRAKGTAGSYLVGWRRQSSFKRLARNIGRVAELLATPRFGSDESRPKHGEAR
ncbi:hypothetical protein [Massilia cavernae]|uniref:Uncharacterized protein n=1 Tax=Massilia cavernae TaxID=2320864 RepID=A0A418X750_9BURK|nr:hypothetical protein [Massilia cavernae]RJG08281.1 hypothetical protein D3872_24740 [Massilia cavernae]